MASADNGSKGRAWVTLLTHPPYVHCVLTTWRTLRSVSKYPLVVMATPTLPEESRRICREQGLTIVDVDIVTPASHGGFEQRFLRFANVWTKVRAFGLDQYEKIVAVDSDVLFLKGMDEIFDLELPGKDWIGAAPACVCNPLKIPYYPKDWIPENCAISRQTRYAAIDSCPIPSPSDPMRSHMLNSGLVLIQPSKALEAELIHFLDTSPLVPEFRFADQDALCHVFKGRWRPLPWYCNALKTERAVHKDQWADEEVRMIHYILDKPWNAPRPNEIISQLEMQTAQEQNSTSVEIEPSRNINGVSLPPKLVQMIKDTPPQRGVTEYDEVNAWWWIAYEAMIQEMKDQGASSGWQEVDRHVR